MMVLGCGVFGECLSYGGEFLMIGISAFIKRVVERSYSRNKMFCISMSDQVYKLHYLFPLSPLYSFFGGGGNLSNYFNSWKYTEKFSRFGFLSCSFISFFFNRNKCPLVNLKVLFVYRIYCI